MKKAIYTLIFFTAFICMLAYGGHTPGQQVAWTFGWMAIAAWSGNKLNNLIKDKDDALD